MLLFIVLFNLCLFNIELILLQYFYFDENLIIFDNNENYKKQKPKSNEIMDGKYS